MSPIRSPIRSAISSAVRSALASGAGVVRPEPVDWLTITGTTTENQTLTAALGGGAPTVTAYQWLRGYTPISGATSSTYVLTDADVGRVIRVVATHAGGEGYSLPTAIIADAEDPASIYATGVYAAGVYATTSPLAAPSGFSWTPPVDIYYEPGFGYFTTYDDTPFLVEGAPGVTTYYVDSSTGNEANPGTSASPKKSLVTISAGRQSKLLIKARGTFYVGVNGPVQTAHDELCVEAWGGASCVLTTEASADYPFVWTDEGGGVWSAPSPASMHNGINVYSGTDNENLTRYPLEASLAACQATAGTIFRETSPSIKHYVHTLTGASPATGHTIFGTNVAAQDFSAAGRAYVQRVAFHGVSFRGGPAAMQVSGDSAHAKNVEFVRCSFKWAGNFGALQGTGTSQITTYECEAGPTRYDGFSYTTATGAIGGGAVPDALEINNTARDCGHTSAANQGSTTHFGGRVVRVNGTYRDNANDQMAEVGVSYSWNLGCTFGPRGISTTANGVQVGDGTNVSASWLDGCVFDDVAYGVQVNDGSQINYKRMSAPTTNPAGTGTLATY